MNTTVSNQLLVTLTGTLIKCFVSDMIIFLYLPFLAVPYYLFSFIPHQVRHVTHEVRTPLNTVAIGADVLTHEVKQLGDLIPPVMMELVVGIKEASAGNNVVS